MPSVYAVIYEQFLKSQPWVIMARKNFIGFKGEGRPKPINKPIVWNSAGQWVLPGGRVKGSMTSDVNLIDNAKREVEEELNIRLDLDSHLISRPIVKRFQNNSFGVVYFQVQDVFILQDTVNNNIKKAPHDEILSVKTLPLSEATALLPYQLPAPDPEDENLPIDLSLQLQNVGFLYPMEVAERIKIKARDANDWFRQALENMPQ